MNYFMSFKNTEHFQRKVLLSHSATVAVDINVKTLKKNGILLTQFAQNVVEACLFKKYNRLRLFTRKLI